MAQSLTTIRSPLLRLTCLADGDILVQKCTLALQIRRPVCNSGLMQEYRKVDVLYQVVVVGGTVVWSVCA